MARHRLAVIRQFVLHVVHEIIEEAFGQSAKGMRCSRLARTEHEDLVLLARQAHPIVVRIDVELVKRKMSVGEFSERVGLTPANVAVLKNGRAKLFVSALWTPCAACSTASPVICSNGSWNEPPRQTTYRSL
jgi:hypothetical protein